MTGRLPVLAASACLALAVATAGGFLFGPDGRVDAPLEMTVALAVGFVPTGLFLTRSLPRHPVGWLMLGTGILALVAVFAAAWSAWLPAAWLSQWSWWPSVALIPLALLYFPDGALPSARWRPLAWLLLSCAALGTVALAGAALQDPRTLLTSGEAGTPLAHLLVRSVIVIAGAMVLGTVAVVICLLHRLRRADALVRKQLACLLPVGILLVLGIALDAAGAEFPIVPATLALPTAIGAAVLKFQFGDLDLVINRTVVWLVMSAAVLGVFAGSVALLGPLVGGSGSLVGTAMATGLVAAGFDPLRRRVQRAVERLLFGDRAAPHLVLARLGQRMQLASDPGAMLQQLAVTLTEALRVPYARVLVDTGDGGVFVASSGREQPQLAAFPMSVHGERVGTLEVAARRVGEELTPSERTLVSDVASQAAIAAQQHRLTLALQRSRESLVVRGEEERLRIRRDLHDGLGPTLVGTRMQIRAARQRVGDAGVARLLDDAFTDLTECSDEIRRIVDGLRPPALDQGLGEAMRQRADAVFVDLPHTARVDLGEADLPAAVEVALYRIAAEAMSNVVRHAQASRCDVALVRIQRRRPSHRD